MRRSADTIAEHRAALIALDREIGDADHGENLDRGFQAVLPKLDDLAAGSTPGDVLKLVATTLISTVGGAAGPLYGTAYLKAAMAAGEAWPRSSVPAEKAKTAPIAEAPAIRPVFRDRFSRPETLPRRSLGTSASAVVLLAA